MIDLPLRQQYALDSIRRFIADQGYPPTVRELAADMGISSAGAEQHLQALTRKGAIERLAGSPRAISIPREDIDSSQSCDDSTPVDNE